MNLSLKKTLSGPCELVFEAWTKPEIIKKWFSPDGRWQVNIVEMDIRPGGEYSFFMLSPDDGRKWNVWGEYKEIVKNEKLVFSWNTADVKDSLVTVNFRAVGGQTEVDLVHDLLPNQEQVDDHTYGWKGCMENLETNVLK